MKITMPTLKQAACLLLTDGADFYTVSRKDSQSAWGFPGGKKDPGESILETAVREVAEEIGISLQKEHLLPIYTGFCESNGDGHDYLVTTFLYTQLVDKNTFTTVLEEKLLGSWKSIAEMQSISTSPFAEYNIRALNALKTMSAELAND